MFVGVVTAVIYERIGAVLSTAVVPDDDDVLNEASVKNSSELELRQPLNKIRIIKTLTTSNKLMYRRDFIQIYFS